MMIPLSRLKTEMPAVISEVKSIDLLPKLLELGIMPGVELEIQNKAPFRGPISILVNGTKVLIRKKEADSILVEQL
ncbi:MAG: ferrous iron transport protein A [Crocinitomicaceae bacterium]